MDIFSYIKQNSKVPCPRCKNETMEFSEFPGPCKICKSDPEYIKEINKKTNNILKKSKNSITSKFNNYPEVTGIFKDKVTGQDIAVDIKGKKHKIEDTHYDIKNDPHGWKSSGLKVSKLDSKGRENK